MKVIKVNYIKKIESLKLMQKQRRVFAENVSDKISFRSNPATSFSTLIKSSFEKLPAIFVRTFPASAGLERNEILSDTFSANTRRQTLKKLSAER